MLYTLAHPLAIARTTSAHGLRISANKKKNSPGIAPRAYRKTTSMNNYTSFLKSIQNYKETGFSVIPIHPKAKNPVISDWQSRTPDNCSPESDFPSADYNIGVVLGKN